MIATLDGLSTDYTVNLRGVRVVVAGASSYLASRLLPILMEHGANVAALIREPSRGGSRTMKKPARKVIELRCDGGGLENDLRAFGAAIVINCITNYGRNGESPEAIFEANVTVPLNVIEQARRAGVRLVVSIGTALPPGTSYYATSKAEFLTKASERFANHLRLVNARCEMFFGPGETSEGKLPTFVIKSLACNVEEIKMTPGEQQRDFLHVDDVAHAIIRIIAYESAKSTGYTSYDIASGEPTTVRAFAELAHRLSGSSTRLAFGALPYRVNEPMKLNLDPRRLFLLGWRPAITLQQAILDILDDREQL